MGFGRNSQEKLVFEETMRTVDDIIDVISNELDHAQSLVKGTVIYQTLQDMKRDLSKVSNSEDYIVNIEKRLQRIDNVIKSKAELLISSTQKLETQKTSNPNAMYSELEKMFESSLKK